jgi:hypothetical protein
VITNATELVRALERTLLTLANVQLPPGTMEVCRDEVLRADVSAHIAIRSDGHEQIALLMVTDDVARALVRATSGEDDDSLTADTVAELLNVVVGSAQKGAGYQFSLPVAVRAPGHQVKVLSAGRHERFLTRLGDGVLRLHLLEGTIQATKSGE